MARSTLYHSLVPDMTLVDSTKQQSLLEHFSNQHIISDGLPIYRKLQQDDQDSVRLLTVEDLIVIAKRLSPVEVKEQLLRQIKQSIGDKSWRVRYMAAEHFNEVRQWINKEDIVLMTRQLAEAVGIDIVREELIGQYVQLLKDNEAEVRSAASSQIPGAGFFPPLSPACHTQMFIPRTFEAFGKRSYPSPNCSLRSRSFTGLLPACSGCSRQPNQRFSSFIGQRSHHRTSPSLFLATSQR